MKSVVSALYFLSGQRYLVAINNAPKEKDMICMPLILQGVRLEMSAL